MCRIGGLQHTSLDSFGGKVAEVLLGIEPTENCIFFGEEILIFNLRTFLIEGARLRGVLGHRLEPVGRAFSEVKIRCDSR